jgi:hypothetical protein
MKYSCLKLTQDNWCPNYLDRYVEVTYIENISPPGKKKKISRVCVWGEDDCGMEMDFEDKKVALKIFMNVMEMKFVNMRELKDLGFVTA